MGERHDRADGKRVAWAAAAASDIRRHHRLPMPRQRSVCRAEREREKDRESADERGEVPADQPFQRPIRFRDPTAHRVASVHVDGRASARPIPRLDL
jgi:hypothetical protein